MLNKIMKTVSFFAVASVLAACSQPEQAAPEDNADSTNTAYVSENQKFVDQSNAEVKVADPDALLSDLNTPESDQK